jgi:hypothetical protein
MAHASLQVASGLPPRIEAPTARNPSRMLHIRDHLARAAAEGTVSALCRNPWAAEDTLQQLVGIGLGCCAEDVEERMLLSDARAQLAALGMRLGQASAAFGEGPSGDSRVGGCPLSLCASW